MKRFALFVLVCGMFTMISAPTTAMAGTPGKVATSLGQTFCPSVGTPKGYGCWGYFYYRINYDLKRSNALNNCFKYGCGKKYSDPSQRATCNKGCTFAVELEIQ